jgi:hypothetical protein
MLLLKRKYPIPKPNIGEIIIKLKQFSGNFARRLQQLLQSELNAIDNTLAGDDMLLETLSCFSRDNGWYNEDILKGIR